MRIIAGRLGGRQFEGGSRATHPMSEKMRGALFNSLGDVSGLRVLDCFAGTGAISFEAISRGAKSSVAIDSDRPAQKNIDANMRLLGVSGQVKLISAPVKSWSDKNKSEIFDLIIADPPYDKLQFEIVENLERHLNKNGLLVLSWPPHDDLPRFNSLKHVDEKSYGDSRLVFYSNNQ